MNNESNINEIINERIENAVENAIPQSVFDLPDSYFINKMIVNLNKVVKDFALDVLHDSNLQEQLLMNDRENS